MTSAAQTLGPSGSRGEVTVRLWAGAKAAAGTGEVTVSLDASVTVQELADRVLAAFPDRTGLARVLAACSVLVDGQQTPAEGLVRAGTTVEFLPPFAGG